MAARVRPTVNVETFRDDPRYARIDRAVEEILAGGKVVGAVFLSGLPDIPESRPHTRIDRR